MGGQHRQWREALEIGGGRRQRVDPLAEAVVGLGVVPGVEHGPVEHHVAREAEPAIPVTEQVAHPTRAVAGGLGAPELAAPPGERVHLLERPVEPDGPDRRTHVARPVHGEPVGEFRLGLPECERRLEELPFGGRPRHPHAPAGRMRRQQAVPLALLAMVVGVEHPLDRRDADPGEGVEHRAVTEVDDQGDVAISHDVGVAGVRPDEHAGRDFGERHGGLRTSGGPSPDSLTLTPTRPIGWDGCGSRKGCRC